MKLETLLANITHYCDIPDEKGASHLPIYNTATFDLKLQEGNDKVYDYSRSDNPTRNALETIFAKAENGAGCICTNTGIAAISLLFDTVLKSGDSILVEKDCYGGTYRLLNVLKEKNNISTQFADFSDLTEVETYITKVNFKLILVESPTNPGLKVLDLKAISNLAKKHNILFAVDNSLATFASQKPLDLGADFSVFSTTKYVSGHGSVTAGAIVSKNANWAKKVQYLSNAEGKAQSPFDVYLVSLGLPTLPYRMKIQEASALKIAEFLQKHPDVIDVKFPGLKSHPQFELAKSQMKIIPAVLTINLVSEEKAEQLIKNSKLLGEKVSFGTADSRIEIPSKMSHATFSEEDLIKIGLTKSTVRISVGLEDTQDLIDDITEALKS
ncbi:MAG: PLP-dependent aspartate aminotransferase family protein [Bacteroidota bacterium]